MAATDVAATLNDLLAVERSSLALRLIESTPFVSTTTARAADVVQRMARATELHAGQLISLIYELGGEVGPARVDMRTANLHYQELGYVLPRLIADQEARVRGYQETLPALAGSPQAVSVVGRILARHESDFEALRSLAAPRTNPHPQPA